MSPTVQASDNVSTGSFFSLIVFLTDTKLLRPFLIRTPLKNSKLHRQTPTTVFMWTFVFVLQFRKNIRSQKTCTSCSADTLGHEEIN